MSHIFHAKALGCGCIPKTQPQAAGGGMTDAEINSIIKQARESGQWPLSLSLNNSFYLNKDQISQGLSQGWSQRLVGLGYNAPDWAAVQLMQANVYLFSATKSISEQMAMNALLQKYRNDPAGFEREASKVLTTYNRTWLNIEFEFARSTAQNAANYYRAMDPESIAAGYTWFEYQTVGDANVRAAHQALDGLAAEYNDPVWLDIWPPNGFRCRCTVVPALRVDDDKKRTGKELVDILKATPAGKGQSEWQLMQKTGMAVNRGAAGYLFDLSGKYGPTALTEGAGIGDVAKLTYKDFGLAPASELVEASPKILLTEYTAQEAMDVFNGWVASRKVDDRPENDPATWLLNHEGHPLTLSFKAVDKHLKGSYMTPAKGPRSNYLSLIPNVISEPDEVWLYAKKAKDNKGQTYYVYQQRYLKYLRTESMFEGNPTYNDGPIIVITESQALNPNFAILTKDLNAQTPRTNIRPNDIISWFPNDGDPDFARNGVLTYKKKK